MARPITYPHPVTLPVQQRLTTVSKRDHWCASFPMVNVITVGEKGENKIINGITRLYVNSDRDVVTLAGKRGTEPVKIRSGVLALVDVKRGTLVTDTPSGFLTHPVFYALRVIRGEQ